MPVIPFTQTQAPEDNPLAPTQADILHAAAMLHQRDELAPQQDMVGQQLAMDPELGRRNIQSDLPTGFGGGGYKPMSLTQDPIMEVSKQYPKSIQDSVTEWAQGKIKGIDLLKSIRDRGWMIEPHALRGRGNEIEMFDPTGKAHYVQP